MGHFKTVCICLKLYLTAALFRSKCKLLRIGGGAVQRAKGALQPTGKAVPKEGSAAAAAEVLAVRHAALASVNKAPEASLDSNAPTSPRQPHGVPVLRLRPSVQQVCGISPAADCNLCVTKQAELHSVMLVSWGVAVYVVIAFGVGARQCTCLLSSQALMSRGYLCSKSNV